MALRQIGYIEFPAHQKSGGFDHAAVHQRMARLYVAHTANDAIDVMDCASDRYLRSIPNLTGVAGVLASDEHSLIFTSNRGENTIGIFSPDDESNVVKINVGVRPNGLAYDPTHHLLLAANVGDPAVAGSFTVSMVDVERRALIADIPVSGRTRWAIYDPQARVFYVNIADPAQMVVIDANRPTQVSTVINVPVAGPHGLDLDLRHRRLFSACDAKRLVTCDADSHEVLSQLDLSGTPDVIFFNAARERLYVAIGNPGVIDVFDTTAMKRIQVVTTESGAHTIGFAADRNKVYAFLPQTHRAAVYVDGS
jgi:DNA-binding beta-propeller fold protein YncE